MLHRSWERQSLETDVRHKITKDHSVSSLSSLCVSDSYTRQMLSLHVCNVNLFYMLLYSPVCPIYPKILCRLRWNPPLVTIND